MTISYRGTTSTGGRRLSLSVDSTPMVNVAEAAMVPDAPEPPSSPAPAVITQPPARSPLGARRPPLLLLSGGPHGEDGAGQVVEIAPRRLCPVCDRVPPDYGCVACGDPEEAA